MLDTNVTATPAPDPNSIHYTNYKLPSYSPSLLILWSVITASTSVVGNSVVLVGALRHNAIRCDRLSLVLIKNLAVSDIVNTFIVVIPGIATLYTGKALFNDNKLFCTISGFAQFIVPIFNCLIICALSVNKMLILLNPWRTFSGWEWTGHVLVVGAWITGFTPAIEYLIIGNRITVFDTRICRLKMFVVVKSTEGLEYAKNITY